MFCLLWAGFAWGQTQEEFQRLFDEHYLPQVRQLLESGELRAAEVATGEAMDRGADKAAWRMVYLRALWGQGRLRKAAERLPAWVEEHRDDVRFLALAAEAFEELGDGESSRSALLLLNEAAQQEPLTKRTAEELVALGNAAFALGASPDQVLERFYERAKQLEPESPRPYLAAGELALAKYDYDRAAREFRAGLKQSPLDAGLRFGLARSLWPGNREEALTAANKVLESNARHVGAMLMKVEHLLDQEQYEEAETVLGFAQRLFPGHPLARAYTAVIAWLRDFDAEKRDAAFEDAMAYRARNPEVPHVIGRCLSRKYRIAEGERYQRMALEWEPDHPGAKLALTTDLLKQGREEEAWALAEEAAKADPYNVLAYNYQILGRQLAKYETRETEHFVLRMRPDEMAIYGDRVLALLEEARAVLNAKYAMNLERKTLVEIFAEQQDFAIRTFGELGGAGYLGVCFGTVITMNSPAGAGVTTLSNWEATLWHEYCHVVTLTATMNRMPRWLSEGISVYEERQRSPVWGAQMTRGFRKRILEGGEGEGGLIPVQDLSSAFLRVKKPEDLMFAYFESSLVVEYLAERHGLGKVRAILASLAEGKRINEALQNATGDLAALEAGFAAYARGKADAYGGEVDWTEPGADVVNPLDFAAVSAYAAQHSRNLWAKRRLVEMHTEGKRWEEAMAAARAMISLFPEFVEEGNGYALLAEAARGAGDRAAESWAWEEFAKRKGDATEAYLRLIDLGIASDDRGMVRKNAERTLAVNPFVKRAHWCRACAAAETGDREVAADSFGKLLRLGPENPAEVHYRLARVLRDTEPERARREVVEALLEAPRFAEAHELLAELVEAER